MKDNQITEMVLKIASRCNINCTYCYMYNMGDNSYLKQPKHISQFLIEKIRDRINEHCIEHSIKCFAITLHGGEPLLIGKKRFEEIVSTLKSIEDDQLEIRIAVQTNGILLDSEWCSLFRKYRINIGISLDGDEQVNDERRIDHKGKGTYQRVLQGINTCLENDINFGVLSVTNTNVNPIEAYEHFKSIGIRGFDFLLLDENYDHFENQYKFKMADWLISIFDAWFKEKEYTSIRIFEGILKGILGDDIFMDSLGTAINKAIIIETDGSIESLDVLKICGEEFTKNNLNVVDNSFNDVFSNPLLDLYFNSGKYLSKKCLACPVSEICAGGYLPHRYSSENGFNNPSVYCDDLLRLITHIQGAVIDEIPEELRLSMGVEKLTYEDALVLIQEKLPLIEDTAYMKTLEDFGKKHYA